MIISKYGVVLKGLTKDQIEIVRDWRNAHEISQFMEYKEYITPQMQDNWFNSLDEFADFYFIIEYKAQQIGLIHISNIDWKSSSAHAGLFIGNADFLNTHVPLLSSLAMLDAFFLIFNISKVYAKVLQSNTVAVRYNTNLGFKPFEPQDKHEFQQYLLTKEDYLSITRLLHESAKRVGGELSFITIRKELFERLIGFAGGTFQQEGFKVNYEL